MSGNRKLFSRIFYYFLLINRMTMKVDRIKMKNFKQITKKIPNQRGEGWGNCLTQGFVLGRRKTSINN